MTARNASAKSAPTTVPAVEKVTTAPETPAAPVAKEAPTAVALNLSALAPAAVKVPERAPSTGAGRSARDNSVVEGWLRDLDKTRDAANGDKTSKEARALNNLPGAAYGELRTRFVQAAAKLGIGIALSYEFTDKAGKSVPPRTDSTKLPDGVETFSLVYVTKARKQNKATVKAVTGTDTVTPATDAKNNAPKE